MGKINHKVTVELSPNCYRDLKAKAEARFPGRMKTESALREYLESVIEEHYYQTRYTGGKS